MIQTALENGKYEVIELLKSGRKKQASRLAKTLVTKSPKDPSLRFLSGLVSLSAENKTIAAKHFSNAIKLGSKDVAAFTNLATLQMTMNALPAANKTLALAARRFGDDQFQILHLTAMLRIAENRQAEALLLAERCIALDGANVEGWLLKGRVLRNRGQLFEAIESFRRAADIDPAQAHAYSNLSWLLATTNQSDEALQLSQDAAARIPNGADLLLPQLAERYVEAGRFDDAIEVYQTLCKDPVLAPASLRMLAQLLPEAALPTLIDDASKLIKARKGPDALGQLHLALHTAHRRAGLARTKKMSLGTGNSFLARARPYSNAGDVAYHRAIKDAYAPNLMDAKTPRRTGASVPIFIVGMIRSGTTMLERMLANHSEIGSLGEVALAGRTIDTAIHEGADLPRALSGLSEHYAQYQSIVGNPAFTTDKMPNNYLYIGYLRQAFPGCKIILIKRDFRDVAISAFENYFDSPALNFSYTEAGILNRLKLFEDMTTFWRQMGGVHTVWYEDLIADPARELQRVAEHCGFDLQSDMLHPEHAKAPIRTVSHSQARQAIYTSSHSRWQSDPVAEYLPSVVNVTDNATVPWRLAWLEEMERRDAPRD